MAATQKRTPCLRLLLSVTQAEDEHRVVEVLQKNGIPLCFEARAKGTAPSELLDAIGLGGTTRVLTAGLLPRATSRRCSGPSTRRFLTTSAAQASP